MSPNKGSKTLPAASAFQNVSAQWSGSFTATFWSAALLRRFGSCRTQLVDD